MALVPPVVVSDDSLVAFDKPAGLAVVAERRTRAEASLMDLARAAFGPELANVHRLDPEASGLVLCAKTRVARDFLSGQFQAKLVEKVYETLVVGAPALDRFTVDFVLKEDEAAPGRLCVVKKHGRLAVTECRVLARFGKFTHVECRPQPGLLHQVRLHLAATGTPVLNDRLYGDDTPLLLSNLKRGYKGRKEERPLMGRLALHAAALAFTHPVTRERVTLQAPRPREFAVALKYLHKYAT